MVVILGRLGATRAGVMDSKTRILLIPPYQEGEIKEKPIPN